MDGASAPVSNSTEYTGFDAYRNRPASHMFQAHRNIDSLFALQAAALFSDTHLISLWLVFDTSP
jgi:hypothetical protein